MADLRHIGMSETPDGARQVRRYNCDCLNATPDGRVAGDGEEGVYCQRWVVLAEDCARVEAERDALARRVAELEDAVRWALGERGVFESAPMMQKPRYWWRTTLRHLAFPDPPLAPEGRKE
jgi:hypothetical protein